MARLRTRTRFETEAKGNLEIAYSAGVLALIKIFLVQTFVRKCLDLSHLAKLGGANI